MNDLGGLSCHSSDNDGYSIDDSGHPSGGGRFSGRNAHPVGSVGCTASSTPTLPLPGVIKKGVKLEGERGGQGAKLHPHASEMAMSNGACRKPRRGVEAKTTP